MKFLTIILSFFIGLIIFMPKENLFFTLQKELKKENIFINTKASSNLIDLKLDNSKIFVNKINIANIESIKITPLLFFNKIDLKNIKIDFNHLNIDNLNLTYSILTPFNVDIKGSSNFATIKGFIDLKNRNMKIYLLNLTNKTIKSFLKKDKKGYFYAQKF